MKTFSVIALLVVTASLTACAQSNTNAAPPAPRLLAIDSDSESIDGIGRTVAYRGNVRATDPDMKLTCELLVADLPRTGGRISHIVAETNVVIDATNSNGQAMHTTCDKAVYIFNVENGVTNETVTLTGNPQPRVIVPEGTNEADVIIWDRANNGLKFIGNQHVVGHESFSVGTDAKQRPAATTNESSGRITNSPPGTIENVDRIYRGSGGGRQGGF
jgi:lipopolysaccharide export system protein LptA